MYVLAATACALSASGSKEAGISPATTPGSHSAIVVSTASPSESAVKLMPGVRPGAQALRFAGRLRFAGFLGPTPGARASAIIMARARDMSPSASAPLTA